jgi:predicted ABC-type ATPase
MSDVLSRRPIVVALAGPNGAGKSSFYRAYLQRSGLRFVNADILAHDLRLDPYQAARLADDLRRQLVSLRESFIFETVFSDPVGDKLRFLKDAEQSGYTALLLFVGIDNAQLSATRVDMRVSKGGHNVPGEKLAERFPRIMRNLQQALVWLPNVRVYDNSDLDRPYRIVASLEEGRGIELYPPIPGWLQPLLPPQ